MKSEWTLIGTNGIRAVFWSQNTSRNTVVDHNTGGGDWAEEAFTVPRFIHYCQDFTFHYSAKLELYESSPGRR